MLKTYQFITHCKGDSHSSKTANIILPGLMIKQKWTPLRLQAKCSIQFRVSTNIMQLNLNTISLADIRADGQPDGQQVEQVSQIRYLGSLISEDGYCTKEILSRSEMAKKVFIEKKETLLHVKWIWN